MTFARELALEAPALLYFALPYLNVSQPEEKSLLAKLAICHPLTKGLEKLAPEQKQQLLNSIEIEKWISCFRQPGRDNIRSLVGYLADQFMQIPDFAPIDAQKFSAPILNFLKFANGVFKYGIISRARAQKLGILQVSSLDKNLRRPDEVEVNCIQTLSGIERAVYHDAKGAITVATERFRDPLSTKIVHTELWSGSSQKVPSLKDEDALKELSERAHYALLIICNQQSLSFINNQGEKAEAIKETFNGHCEISSTDGCLEVKIDANIAPQSFLLLFYQNALNLISLILIFSLV